MKAEPLLSSLSWGQFINPQSNYSRNVLHDLELILKVGSSAPFIRSISLNVFGVGRRPPPLGVPSTIHCILSHTYLIFFLELLVGSNAPLQQCCVFLILCIDLGQVGSSAPYIFLLHNDVVYMFCSNYCLIQASSSAPCLFISSQPKYIIYQRLVTNNPQVNSSVPCIKIKIYIKLEVIIAYQVDSSAPYPIAIAIIVTIQRSCADFLKDIRWVDSSVPSTTRPCHRSSQEDDNLDGLLKHTPWYISIMSQFFKSDYDHHRYYYHYYAYVHSLLRLPCRVLSSDPRFVLCVGTIIKGSSRLNTYILCYYYCILHQISVYHFKCLERVLSSDPRFINYPRLSKNGSSAVNSYLLFHLDLYRADSHFFLSIIGFLLIATISLRRTIPRLTPTSHDRH